MTGARIATAAKVGGALICFLTLPAIDGCRGTRSEEIETSDEVPVVIAPARRGSIRPVIAATGVVKPAPGAEATVIAPEPARILELPKAIGDSVRQGDLLARFEIPLLAQDVAGRTADLERAGARLENAQSAASRAEGLFERGIASRKELEDTRKELAEANAALAEAKAASGAANQMAGRRTVRAPFDGVVSERSHNPGDFVEPSASDLILKVIDPARLQVEAAIPLNQVPLVRPAGQARVFGPGSEAAERAVVVSRPVSADPSTASAIVRLAFSGPTQLAAGTPVRIEILGEERADAIIVPSGAIVREGNEAFLFTVDSEGKAHRRKVDLGVINRDGVEVLSGVDAGERVIVQGQAALPDGAAVVVSP